MITVKYERKDIFGQRIYTEDTKNNETLADVKKAFHALKSNYGVAIQIDNTVLFWETMQNFEYGTLTAREYSGSSYTEFIWDYNGCKNNYYAMYRGVV